MTAVYLSLNKRQKLHELDVSQLQELLRQEGMIVKLDEAAKPGADGFTAQAVADSPGIIKNQRELKKIPVIQFNILQFLKNTTHCFT